MRGAEARFSSAPTPSAISTAPSFRTEIGHSPFAKTINHSPTGITRNISSIKPIPGIAESRARFSQVMKSKPVWMNHKETPIVKPRVVFDRSKPSVPRIASPFDLRPEQFKIPSAIENKPRKNRQFQQGRVVVDRFNPMRSKTPELKLRPYSPDGTVSKQDLFRSRIMFQRQNATPLPVEITQMSPKQKERHQHLRFVGIHEASAPSDFRDKFHKKKIELKPAVLPQQNTQTEIVQRPKVVLPPEVRLKIRQKQTAMVDETRKALVATGAFSSSEIEKLLTQRKQQKVAEQRPQIQQKSRANPLAVETISAVLPQLRPKTQQLISRPNVEVSQTGRMDSKEALALLLQKRKKRLSVPSEQNQYVEHKPTTHRRINEALAVVGTFMKGKKRITGDQLASELSAIHPQDKFKSPIVLSNQSSDRNDGGWIENIRTMKEKLNTTFYKRYSEIKQVITDAVNKYPGVTRAKVGTPVGQHVVEKTLAGGQLPIKNFTVYQYSPTS